MATDPWEVRQAIGALRKEDGQALVELAFVLPLVLLFLFAIIDFGLALNQQSSDTNIANLAARTASLIGSSATENCGGTAEPTLAAWVSCEAAANGAPTPSYVCVADTAGASPSTAYAAGDPIKVEIRSNFAWLKLLTGQISSLKSTIGASATMRIEQASSSGTASTFLTGTPTCSS